MSRCAGCGEGCDERAPGRACPGCGAVLHSACRELLGGCSTEGCRARFARRIEVAALQGKRRARLSQPGA